MMNHFRALFFKISLRRYIEGSFLERYEDDMEKRAAASRPSSARIVRGVSQGGKPFGAAVVVDGVIRRQGLPLVHFSTHPEPFLVLETAQTTQHIHQKVFN